MSRTTLRILIILMCLVVFPAGAQPEAERRELSHRTYEEANQTMNAAYQKVLTRLTGVEKAAFIKAQDAWLAWRDAEAESNTIDWRDTNAYKSFLADSKRAMTIDRLATFLKMEAATRPPGKRNK